MLQIVNGCPGNRQNPVTGDSKWFRCGSKAGVFDDQGNEVGVFLDGGNTGIRQLVEQLAIGSVYTISIKVKKALATSTRPVKLQMKPYNNTNGASLAGWSEAETNTNVVIDSGKLVTINQEAYDNASFSEFKFYFTATQENVILQISSIKQGAEGSGIDTYIDDVKMSPDVTWTGATDNDWATGSNWDIELPVGAGNNVTIPSGKNPSYWSNNWCFS